MTASELATTLRRAGFNVSLDESSAKRAVIEQIIFAFQPWIDSDEFDPREFDGWIAEYSQTAYLTIDSPELEEPIGTRFVEGEPLRFGECYTTDTDSTSRAVMRIASVLNYEVEGE